MQDMHDQAAGWYRDPVLPNLHRYWNGHAWVSQEAEKNRLPRQAAPREPGDRTPNSAFADVASAAAEGQVAFSVVGRPESASSLA